MIGWRTIYAAIFVATVSLGSLCFYILQPPEVGRLSETSQVIRSETGQIMNLRLTSKGFWRGTAWVIRQRKRMSFFTAWRRKCGCIQGRSRQ